MKEAWAEELIDAIHIRMIDSVWSIRDDDLHSHSFSADLSESADDRKIRDITMFDEDGFSRSWEFSKDLSADEMFILDIWEDFDSFADFLRDPESFFLLSLFDADSICEFSGEYDHIVMPSSRIWIFSILRSEIFFGDIHPTDDRFRILSSFIEEPDLRVVILFEIFKHDEWAWSDKSKWYIFLFEKFLCEYSREYISSHFSESEYLLRIIYSRTESIFSNVDIDIWIDFDLL